MRIAHFLVGRCNPDSANGVDKAVFHLTAAQAALGHDVALFSVTDKPALPVPDVDVRTHAPGPVRALVPASLTRDLRAWSPQVVHIHSVYVPANAALARTLRGWGVPYVITPHGALNTHVLRRRAYLKRPYRLLVELPALNRAAFVHAIADEASIRAYGVTAPLVVAPNGIDFAAVPPDPDPTTLAERFPAARGRRVALFLGRLDPLHKGLDLLLEGFARAVPRAPELLLAFVGPNWRGKQGELERLAARLGVSDRVIFWGPAHGREKYDLLASASVAVHTSRWEAGVPFSILEALAAGRPCLVSHAADPLGLIASSGAGATIRAEVGEIAGALEGLARASDADLARQGERARDLARREFAWPRIAGTVIAAYARYAA